MPLTLNVEGNDKNQLATSLAALVLSDSKVDVSAENINSVLAAAGINVPAYFPALFATYIEKAGGVDKFFSGPAVGGAAPAASGASTAAAPAAAKAPEKPKEEEVDALDGGMDMFGGGGGGKGDY